jgi:tetratricopeptide (TPR) repeat protein
MLFAAAGIRMSLVARDLEDHPLSGFRFTYGGVTSDATSQAGTTELNLPPGQGPGQQIKLFLVPHSKKLEDWFLVNPQVNIPSNSGFAELILMRRSTFRQIAAEARDAPGAKARSNEQPTAEDQKKALVSAAARRGLTAEQLESAIKSFAETQDPNDRGIAAYLEGRYQRAEELLKEPAKKQTNGLVETLLYLGAAQYQQAEYRAASDSFRTALALHKEEPILLSWLGSSLMATANWTEAEALIRRALIIDEKSYGPEHPDVAISLDNLAVLLKVMNRLAEAEPLMRRALIIDEKRYGPEHPDVAISLDNLAVLLKVTNRLAEAEPLMRRALTIEETSYGPDHPEVATTLNNLAQLFKATNRSAEAEPLMRRALAIDEKSYGPDHPKVARDLSILAPLLQATNRLCEAEPLIRRALAIDEKSYGPDHPDVARDLSILADLLQKTNRCSDAEPMMRRALAIEERSFGPDHTEVASSLNNLAQLLQATNRLAEAEPLMRRALAILLEFARRTGFENPNQEAVAENYRSLLQAMGKSQAEIEGAIKGLK